MRTINIIFNLTYYLKLCNAKVTNYIYIYIYHFVVNKGQIGYLDINDH